MSRADSLLQGTWNGIPFLYLDAGSAHALRGQQHEYPYRDGSYFEPLGQRTPQYTLDIFAVGDDWMAQRDALIQAFSSGRGVLVHPTDGRINAICLTVQRQETVTALGLVNLTVTLLRDDQAPASTARDTGSDADSAGTAAAAAGASSFGSSFNFATAAYDVRNGTESVLGTVLGAIGDAVGFVGNTVGTVLGYVGEGVGVIASTVGAALAWYQWGVDTVGNVVRTVLRDASVIVGIPDMVVQAALGWSADFASTVNAISLLGGYPGLPGQLQQLTSGISGLRETGSGDAFQSWAQQRRVGPARTVLRAASATDASAGFVQVTIGGYSKTTIIEIFLQQLDLAASTARPTANPAAPAQLLANTNAVYDLVRQAALIEAAGAFSAIGFSSKAEAYALRDQLANALDDECNIVDDGAVRRAFYGLRIAVVADAKARSQSLPAVVSLTLPRTVPAVVLAARLYDDPGMALDLVQRNDVSNPLFMPAGVALEVLAYA